MLDALVEKLKVNGTVRPGRRACRHRCGDLEQGSGLRRDHARGLAGAQHQAGGDGGVAVERDGAGRRSDRHELGVVDRVVVADVERDLERAAVGEHLRRGCRARVR